MFLRSVSHVDSGIGRVSSVLAIVCGGVLLVRIKLVRWGFYGHLHLIDITWFTWLHWCILLELLRVACCVLVQF